MRYEISSEQLKVLKDASKPVPYMIFGGMEPRSPQENANNAWRRLGDEMGFRYMTVLQIPGEPETVFDALPKGEDDDNA